MNSRKLAAVLSVLALALVLGFTTFSGGKARAAATCSVPSLAYPTIQSAASDATCTQIDVAAGAYNENVVVNNPTTINGAQVGNDDFATRNANLAGESIVNGVALSGAVAVFRINVANVTINGFTIKNSVTSGAAMGITVAGGGNNASILNNIIDTITTPDINGTAQAIYLTSGGPDGANIENNEMKNVHSSRSAKGVLVGDNGGTNPSQNVQVKGNSIHDITSDSRGAYGVSVASVPNVSGLQIVKNTINDLSGGGWVHAIGLEGDTPAVVVSENDISNLSDLSPTVPADSIGVFFESNPSFGSAQVHLNNFNLTTTSFGIAVHPALTGGSVNGECNWWNSPSGPTHPTANPDGTGTQVSDEVIFSPWLIAPAPDGPCGATKKECEKFYEQQKKDFEEMQKTQKKDFDSQPHTKEQKKAFDEQQKDAKKTFEEQNKANKEQCKTLPKN
jgi:hypothetical protein